MVVKWSRSWCTAPSAAITSARPTIHGATTATTSCRRIRRREMARSADMRRDSTTLYFGAMVLTYRDGEPFPGHVGSTLADSTPAWPTGPRARDGAPNVLLVVLDDVGYAQLGCFGSDIDTPNIDALARRGLRYRNFHTTAMCAPTRACLMTGRNPHTCGIGGITDFAMGFPGYNGRIPRSCGFVSEMLRQEGWATFAVGKWHLAPSDELHAAGVAGPVAARPGLRALLRLPRGRDEPLGTRPGERQHDAHVEFPARIPHDRGPCRPHDQHRERPARRRPGQTVLLLPCTRGVPRAAPRAARVHRPLRRPLRRRLGRVAGADPRAPARLGSRPAGHDAVAPPRLGAGMGGAARERAAGLRAHDGGVCRLPHAHRPPARPRARLPRRHRRARPHARGAAVRQRRERRRRTARHVQRELPLQRDGARRRCDDGVARRARRSQQLRPLPVGMGLRREHAVQALEARDARGRHR